MSRPVNPLDAVPDRFRPLADRSVEVLRDHQDPGGAWPASPTFEPYGYSWFRDGSFIAEGASAAGLHDEATLFHGWCARVLERESSAVDRGDQLPARYALDGTRHDDDWWNFQVDGYGTWLWALERHLARSGGDVAPYASGVETAVRYLVATGTGPCRDWWEENLDETHVTTLAGVAAGLLAAVRTWTLPRDLLLRAVEVADECTDLIVTRGTHEGHLVKWLGGTDVDASLLAVAAVYDVLPLDDPLVTATVSEIEARLVNGGVHRYEADTFYGGGQWPVLASLLAWHHVRAGNDSRAGELLDWVAGTASDDLLLPEQVAPLLGPDSLDEWLERWGPPAHPLLWSHGMFLAVAATAR